MHSYLTLGVVQYIDGVLDEGDSSRVPGRTLGLDCDAWRRTHSREVLDFSTVHLD